MKCPSKNKYNAKKVVIDGITFHSTGEGKRYLDLKKLLKAGLITDLRLQVAYQLHGTNNAKVSKYIADFVYMENGVLVVEDFKGKKTAMYNLKKKFFEAEYDIKIRETRKNEDGRPLD